VVGDGALLDAVTARLAAAGCVAAGEEAAELLGCSSGADELEARLRRRERGEPLAWIVGWVSFCGHPVRVDPGVYVPRPQTEELARRAAALLARSPGMAADLCTGSGAVAAHMARAVGDAGVVATDVDFRALACARANGVRAVACHAGAALGSGCFDVVTAVAPYVPTGALGFLPGDVLRYEPVGALDGGADGLDLVRRVARDAARLLRPGGWLLLEIGGEQDRSLAPHLQASGFERGDAWGDAEGDLRGIAARLGRGPRGG
jgi:release factor glutamine methyltransferase